MDKHKLKAIPTRPGGKGVSLSTTAAQFTPAASNLLINNLVSQNGQPCSPRQHFFDQLEHWETSLPLTSLWMLFFDVPLVVQEASLKGWGEHHIDMPWGVDRARGRLTDGTGSMYTGYGCAIAQTVGIPVEQMGIDITGPTNRGFLKGPIIQQRQAWASLNIEFLETTLSFNDFVLRPWVITASHQGLVAREDPRERITTDMFIVNMTRAGTDMRYDTGKGQWINDRGFIPRKIWLFKDCLPVNIGQEKYSYSTTSNIDRRDTEWSFRKYQVIAPESLHSTMDTIDARLQADAKRFHGTEALVHKNKHQHRHTTDKNKTKAEDYWSKNTPKLPQKRKLKRSLSKATIEATDYWGSQEPPRPGGAHVSAKSDK